MPQVELERPTVTEAPGVRAPEVRAEPWARIFWRRFRRHKLALVGALVLLALISSAVLAPYIAEHSPRKTNLLNRLKPPDAARGNYFGTDYYGRDIFARVLHGGRISLTVGFLSVAILATIGITLGAVAGYYGGLIDNLIMRFTDIVLSFPALFLLIYVIAVVGPSVTNIIIVIGVLSWPGVARLVRAEFLSLKTRDFVEAARAQGVPDSRIIFRHILPNSMAPIIVAATLAIPGAVLAETGLSYLGLGVQPPTPSWGNILYEGQAHIRRAWWYTFFPGLFIFVTVMAFNLVGDALRDALDPRLKQ